MGRSDARHGFLSMAPSLRRSLDRIVLQRAHDRFENRPGSLNLHGRNGRQRRSNQVLDCSCGRAMKLTARCGEAEQRPASVTRIRAALHESIALKALEHWRERSGMNMEEACKLARCYSRKPTNHPNDETLRPGHTECGGHSFRRALECVVDGPDEPKKLEQFAGCEQRLVGRALNRSTQRAIRDNGNARRRNSMTSRRNSSISRWLRMKYAACEFRVAPTRIDRSRPG